TAYPSRRIMSTSPPATRQLRSSSTIPWASRCATATRSPYAPTASFACAMRVRLPERHPPAPAGEDPDVDSEGGCGRECDHQPGVLTERTTVDIRFGRTTLVVLAGLIVLCVIGRWLVRGLFALALAALAALLVL